MFSIFNSKACPHCKSKAERIAQLEQELADFMRLTSAQTKGPSDVGELQAENAQLQQMLDLAQGNWTRERERASRLESENSQLRHLLQQVKGAAQTSGGSAQQGTYIASTTRSHFHRPGCVWIENLPQHKAREFHNHEEAVKAGYKPCKTCCA